jgi:hypothetical protein
MTQCPLPVPHADVPVPQYRLCSGAPLRKRRIANAMRLLVVRGIFKVELNSLRSSLNKVILFNMFHVLHRFALAHLYCYTCPARQTCANAVCSTRPFRPLALPAFLSQRGGQPVSNCEMHPVACGCTKGGIQPVVCLQCLHCDISTVLSVSESRRQVGIELVPLEKQKQSAKGGDLLHCAHAPLGSCHFPSWLLLVIRISLPSPRPGQPVRCSLQGRAAVCDARSSGTLLLCGWHRHV